VTDTESATAPVPAEETDRGRSGLGKVIAILGPTGVGKTQVASRVAKYLGTRVISCDSMQVYKGFPVLTNQPTAGETLGVEHALVGFLEPAAPLSAAAYAELARPLLVEDLKSRGGAVLAGGTGLYLRAALAPLAVAPQDREIRSRLEARAAAGEGAALYEELARLDPQAAATIDPRNVRRVVRALEVVLCGHKWSGRRDLWEPRYEYPTLVFGLTMERRELHRRLDARTRRMLSSGAVEEVRRFRERLGRERTAPGGPGIRSAIGYPEIWRFLDGEQSLEETVRQVAAATRRYARRQLTWLRKVRGAVIIDTQGRGPEEIAQQILAIAGSAETREEGCR
jgi:tRNA dimethylallyltransferase